MELVFGGAVGGCAAVTHESYANQGRAGHVEQHGKPLNDRQLHSLRVATMVKTALLQKNLFFAFQPIVCAVTGEVDYFECLLRMRDGAGNPIPSADFITAIEDLGLIGLIDHFVLEKAVRELRAHPGVRLGFNVSGLTACDRAWLSSLIALLRDQPDLARRLVVEITETAAICDFDESARFVDAVRQAGCRVALDDFGAGHTSLRHLQTLSVDTVKIDGSFIRNLAEAAEKRIFLRHLLGLAKSFGMSTVAECVENAEDAALLRAEGIGYLQGYHVGAPSIERPWLAESYPRGSGCRS